MKKTMILFLILTSTCAFFGAEKAYAKAGETGDVEKEGHVVIDCYLHEIFVGTTPRNSILDTFDFAQTCFNVFAEEHRSPTDPNDTHPSLPRCFKGNPRIIPRG